MHGNTLVKTTFEGVRPLGVRGEPLHQTHEQIRAVIRRRIDDRHAALLAEPEAHADRRTIDWYSPAAGHVVPLSALPEERRAEVRAEIGEMLARIAAAGDRLATAEGSDAAIGGKSLRLATVFPSDDFLFLVGDQPTVICWGYDREQATALLPRPFLPTVGPAPAPAPPLPPAAIASAPAVAAAAPTDWRAWLLALLLGLLLILLALGAGWALRHIWAADPALAVTRQPQPPAPPAPPPEPDPTPEKKASLSEAEERENKLKLELAALQDQLKAKIAECKPPEPPKVAEPPKPPPPPPPPPKKAEPPKPPEKRPEPPPQQATAPPAPPPGALPCNTNTGSGGHGLTRNVHFLGNRPGFVRIAYDMKRIPDRMNVYYRGQLVASTQGMQSGIGMLSFDFQPVGNDYTVVVEVIGPMRGTEWMYALDCPR